MMEKAVYQNLQKEMKSIKTVYKEDIILAKRKYGISCKTKGWMKSLINIRKEYRWYNKMPRPFECVGGDDEIFRNQEYFQAH